jgi:hypothetical protein
MLHALYALWLEKQQVASHRLAASRVDLSQANCADASSRLKKIAQLAGDKYGIPDITDDALFRAVPSSNRFNDVPNVPSPRLKTPRNHHKMRMIRAAQR